MANFPCAKCGSQALTYISGVKAATGKAWQGWQCDQCKTKHGMNGIPWGNKPKAPQQQVYKPETPQGWAVPQNPIEKKLDLIISMLKTLQGDMGVTEANKELNLEAENSQAPF